jgi:WD40 repeat protein
MPDACHPTRRASSGSPFVRATGILALAASLLLPSSAAADESVVEGHLEIAARIRAHTPWVRCLAWSPDGQTLASGGNDRAVRLWDASAAEPLAEARVERDAHGDP